MKKKYVNAEEAEKLANECELLGINDKVEPELVEEFKKSLIETAKKEGHDIEETVNKILELADTLESDEYKSIAAATILIKLPLGYQVALLKRHLEAVMAIAGRNFMKRMGNPEEAAKVLAELSKNIKE